MADLTVIATKIDLMRGGNGGPPRLCARALGQMAAFITMIVTPLAHSFGPTRPACLAKSGFRLGF
ncbi:MAG: hypothetical protein ACYC3S_04930 [Chloroflexota bacterium]